MTYKFTNRAKKAIEMANELAIELGHNYIGTEHILYGLVIEEKGLAYKVLSKQGINESLILNKIREILGIGKTKINRTDGFTPRTKKVIENSFKETEKNLLSNIVWFLWFYHKRFCTSQ